MEFIYSDGGREEAGYKGHASDCVLRAFCNCLDLNYAEMYSFFHHRMKTWADTSRTRSAKLAKSRNQLTPRNGVSKQVYHKIFCDEFDMKWTPTMGIGTGCKVHLLSDELPSGNIIVRVSKHLTCVKDGMLHDTYDCSREGTRCVYGYWEINN